MALEPITLKEFDSIIKVDDQTCAKEVDGFCTLGSLHALVKMTPFVTTKAFHFAFVFSFAFTFLLELLTR